MHRKGNLHGDGLAGGKWLLVILAAVIVLLASLTLRRVAPAADISMGRLESGYSFVTTDPPQVACNRLEQLERFQALARDSAKDTSQRYYQSQYPSCRLLKAGKRARVDDQQGLLGRSVCVRLEGTGRCLWTVREAIERG